MLEIIRQASKRFKKEKPAGEWVLRWIGFSILLAFFVFMLPHEGFAKSKKVQQNQPHNKYASIIIDADTGIVLSEKYASKRVHPASLTKVMTLMLLFDALESGNVRLNDKIAISNFAARQQPSKIGLQPGSFIRVEDAILAIVTKSANDIAVATAEFLDGSESRFASRMNHRARDIGMKNTYFTNASGLHNPRQVTTARDMAILARYVLVRYPNYYRYFGTRQFTYRGVTMTNHNKLMSSYAGMDGFKTGYINASGFNLIASAKRGGHRLIGVVFGGRTWKSRNDEMASLLNAGFVEVNSTRFAKRLNSDNKIVVASSAIQKPHPLPAPKPVLRTTGETMQTAALPPQAAPTSAQPAFTSLAALETNRTLVAPTAMVPAQNAPPPTPAAAVQPDITEQAAVTVKNAIAHGDYSEITGEGDIDPGTLRRVETGLLSAAVYKGEHQRAEQIKLASANIPSGTLQLPPTTTQAAPVALPPIDARTPSPSELWSVQIGAYTSRVSTDDALRLAASKLPSSLSHASPIVVPLKTGDGILFRARLGNFTQAEATSACLYFRDCLTIPPK